MTRIYRKIANCANNETRVFRKFLILFIIGFFIIFVGIMILMVATVLSGDSVNFGALIWIIPFFPIVVGAGPEASWMALFAIILGVLGIIMFLILRREMKKANV